MKKQLLTLALLAVAGTAGAQQLPNVGFEGGGKSSNGSTLQTSSGKLDVNAGIFKTTCVAQTEDKSQGMRQRPGFEPIGWNGSNVNQFVVMEGSSPALVTEMQSEGRGHYVKLTNSYVGTNSIGATAPAYITLGTPWVHACSDTNHQDGGTYGGEDFKFRPDAIKGIYKRTNVSGKSENAHIIVYFWTGTFTSNIGKKSPGVISKEDVDRAIMGKPNAGTITGTGKLIASADYSFATTTNDDWQEIEVPIEWVDKTTVPAKMNVIISSADYWNRENIVSVSSDKENGSILEVDDVQFVYYHALSSISYNGTNISGFDENTTTYDLSSYDYDENKFAYVVKGVGASAVRNYNKETGVLTVTVNGNNVSADPTSKTIYTFQFRKAPTCTGKLTSLTVNGENVELSDDKQFYVVTGEHSANSISYVAEDGAYATVEETYDEVNHYSLISVTAPGIEDPTYYFVKFAKAGDQYLSNLFIGMGGMLDNLQQNVEIAKGDKENTIDLQLRNFTFKGTNMGDIFVYGIPYNPVDGSAKLHKELGVEDQFMIFGDAGASLYIPKLVLDGDLTNGKLNAVLNISWDQMYGQGGEDSYVPILVNVYSPSATSVDLSDANFKGAGAKIAKILSSFNSTPIVYLPEGETVSAVSNVVVGTAASNLSLTDGNDWGVTKDFTAAAVSYDRVFKNEANYVQSFVLPFGFTVPAGTTVAELSSVNGDNLVFKPVTVTEANKPYLVVTNDKNFINKLTNVEVKATTGADLTTTVEGVSHIGSYTAQNVANVYGYSNGKFVKANTGSVKPFRTYVKVAGTQAAPMAFGVNIEGTVTGINNATTAATAKEAIYNLQGVRVSGDLKHLTKGVYIVNGQKVVVK